MEKLIKQLFTILEKNNWQLTTAESCTGGLVGAAITSVPGSSKWFERGFITYSNQAKEEVLGVDPSTLMRYGAVSEPVALEMAQGAIAHSQAEVALAITGIAGPEGGTVEKPVGTVWFAWTWPTGCHKTAQYQFQGDRAAIREQACHQALEGLLQALEETACQQ